MITASIVVHDSPVSEVERILSCIRRADVDKIWLVFNGKESKKSVYQGLSGVVFIQVPNNGYGAAHNTAMIQAMDAGSDYHLIVNSDVYWEGDVITTLVDRLREDAGIGLIAPEVVYPNGELQYSCRMLPWPFITLVRGFLPQSLFRKSRKRYLLMNMDQSRPINAPYLLGCFMLVRMDAIKETGLFDERFFMYPEDIDLSRRLHRHWITLYEPKVSVIHEHRRESHKKLKMRLIHIYNMILYFNKWGWFNDNERKEFNSSLK